MYYHLYMLVVFEAAALAYGIDAAAVSQSIPFSTGMTEDEAAAANDYTIVRVRHDNAGIVIKSNFRPNEIAEFTSALPINGGGMTLTERVQNWIDDAPGLDALRAQLAQLDNPVEFTALDTDTHGVNALALQAMVGGSHFANLVLFGTPGTTTQPESAGMIRAYLNAAPEWQPTPEF